MPSVFYKIEFCTSQTHIDYVNPEKNNLLKLLIFFSMANLSCRLISTLRPINSIASCLSRTTFRPTNNCRKLSPTICSLNSSISQCRSFSVSSWRYQKLNSDEDSLNTVNELRKVLKKVARKRRTVTDVEDAPSVDPKVNMPDVYDSFVIIRFLCFADVGSGRVQHSGRIQSRKTSRGAQRARVISCFFHDRRYLKIVFSYYVSYIILSI